MLAAALAVLAASFPSGYYTPPASDTATPLVRSTTWRQQWTTWPFPATPSLSDTPLFITRYLRLPEGTQPGDIVLVTGREEWSHDQWDSPIAGGTPVMWACGIAITQADTYTTDPAGWQWVAHPVAENFTAAMHHAVYNEAELFIADGGRDYLGVMCYFSRYYWYRDPAADWIEAHPEYGKIEAAIINRPAAVEP